MIEHIAKSLGISIQDASVIVDAIYRIGYYIVDPDKLSATARYEVTGEK